MPPKEGAQPVSNPGVLYTNNGTGELACGARHGDRRPGTTSATPTASSPSPPRPCCTPHRTAAQGRTTAFEPGPEPRCLHLFRRHLGDDARRQRASSPSPADSATRRPAPAIPKAFTYEFDDNTFPNIPLIQPRLNSVEEWKITNRNNDEHPMHIHVNDFQVTQVVDPIAGTTTGVQPWGQDNVNVPAPVTDANENPLEAASVTLRTEFTEYTGTFVIHCHRLNHEDNGLMALVNVIPEVSTYGVAVPGGQGTPATVQVHDGSGDQVLAHRHPVPGVRGHTDGCDGGRQRRHGPRPGRRQRRRGRPRGGRLQRRRSPDGPFTTEITRFTPFDTDFRRRGDRRRCRYRRKCPGRQHHRRIRSGHRVPGEGVLDHPAGPDRHRTRGFRQFRAVPRVANRVSRSRPEWSMPRRAGPAS